MGIDKQDSTIEDLDLEALGELFTLINNNPTLKSKFIKGNSAISSNIETTKTDMQIILDSIESLESSMNKKISSLESSMNEIRLNMNNMEHNYTRLEARIESMSYIQSVGQANNINMTKQGTMNILSSAANPRVIPVSSYHMLGN